jgi:hypothetical protein
MRMELFVSPKHCCLLYWNLHQTPKDSLGCLMLTISGLVFPLLAKAVATAIAELAPKVLQPLSKPLESLRQSIKFLFAVP